MNQYYKKDYSTSKNDVKEIVVKEKITNIEFLNINFHLVIKKFSIMLISSLKLIKFMEYLVEVEVVNLLF